MIRYHVRDLGRGLLEPGGLNADGAAVFTEIVEERSPLVVTAMASVASPSAPVVRHLADGGGPGTFFRTHAGGIDRAGVLVGTAVPAPPYGSAVTSFAIRVEGGEVRARYAPLPGFDASTARTIAFDGSVIGDSLGPHGSAATLWREGQTVRLDAGLPRVAFSRAIAVNRRGTVLGLFGAPVATASGPPARVRGWLRDANQGVEVDVGPTGIDAFPTDLNDDGRVVGGAADQLGWYAQRSGSARRLALLPGTAVSAACGVSSPGSIVGSCDGTACLWEHPEDPTQPPVDLNTRANVPERGRLHRATRINDAGLILCQGSSDRGPERVYLLVPHAGAEPLADEIPDGILLGLQPRAGVFGVRLARPAGDGDPPRGRLSLSKLCKLVSALECPPCLGLVDAPCGPGWGVAIEGVPDETRVTLFEGGHWAGALVDGPPRGEGAPFASKTGRRSLEIVFEPSGRNEHFLLFEGPDDRARAEVVFPIRLTIFRADELARA